MRVIDLEAIRIKLASPEDVLSWSFGEVAKAETINYRNQRPEKDGLFCEKIFGPEKDYECYCGKYKKIRYKGIICDRCGVEVTKSSVRRERMGHIKLACPVSHIWFLRGVPSRMGSVLDIPMQRLEKVIYFAAYIVIQVNEPAKQNILQEIEKEYQQKLKSLKKDKDDKSGPEALKQALNRAKEEVSSLSLLSVLSEEEYHEYSLKYGEAFEAETGAEALRKIFEKIDLKKVIDETEKEIEKSESALSSLERRKLLKKLKFFKGMHSAGVRPEWMFLVALPVLPPDLRPIVQLDGGRYASSDLNDLYRRVINRNNRLKYLIEINAPEVIIRNEKRMLQEAVDALIDNEMRKGVMTQATTGGRRLLKSLADMLKGKQGRFRQNLLGKRVDYSGRSVIVAGPELNLYQCGLPKKMALELFKPFVINKILEREIAYNVRGATRVLEDQTDEVWEILEEIVRDKTVFLNRAPTLHRLGIQSFRPILIEGEAIRIHPLVCRAFNADFDGDQMAVHVPLSLEAQKESEEIMLSSLGILKPATGLPIVSPHQDIVLGCYCLTRILENKLGEGKIFGSAQEAKLAREFGLVDLNAKIFVNFENGKIETSVGRIIFNEIFPQDFPYQNELVGSKKIEQIIRLVVEKYGIGKSQVILDKIKETGFEYATFSGISWGMDDLIIPPEKKDILEEAEKEQKEVESHYQKGFFSREEKTEKVIEIWHKVKSKIEKLVPKTLPADGSVFTIIDSGARGSWSQPIQMAGMKGLVINPAGKTIELPIKSSFKEGLGVLEYFISTHGARKGTVDTALRTSAAGYLTRRLVDVAHEVIISEEDCKDNQGFEVTKKEAEEIDQSFVFKITGKTSLEDIVINKEKIVKKGEIIDWGKAELIVKEDKIEKVSVRSPLACKTHRGMCQKCYGWDLGTNQEVKIGEAVGVVAAQAIGEPGTQLTMKTFHTGGVASGGDITFGLPRVQEVFEARLPKGKADVSHVDGKVVEITSDHIIKVKPFEKKSKKDVIEYKISLQKTIWVKEGEEVKKGTPLCEGSLDLMELFKLEGEKRAQQYIISEIQKVYVSQGVGIHDKHIEVIIRQMFSRVRIKDPGSSTFTPGEVIERAKFWELNEELKTENKKPMTALPVLLGISRVALTTDSFLSAASFQETSRVLISAALQGREDKLRGLKENVIIGKLIPAGTGFKPKPE